MVYNGKDTIEKTIKSVLAQPYEKLEYIIIDGGSDDGTQAIIEKYDSEIDFWISERDKGIYDAMNKGLKQAGGEGVLFLNSGDYLVGDVFGENPTVPSFLPVKYEKVITGEVYDKVGNYKQSLPVCHQGIIFENKNIYYDLSYEIASDYDFFLKHGYTGDLPTLEVNGFVYYDNSGFSAVNYTQRDEEISNIIYKHFGMGWMLLFKAKAFVKRQIKKLLKWS